jgi:hypothetical protein
MMIKNSPVIFKKKKRANQKCYSRLQTPVSQELVDGTLFCQSNEDPILKRKEYLVKIGDRELLEYSNNLIAGNIYSGTNTKDRH